MSCDRCPSTDSRTVMIDGTEHELCEECYRLVTAVLTRGGESRA